MSLRWPPWSRPAEHLEHVDDVARRLTEVVTELEDQTVELRSLVSDLRTYPGHPSARAARREGAP